MDVGLYLSFGLLSATIAALIFTMWYGRRHPVLYGKLSEMSKRYEELSLRVVELELDMGGFRWWTAQLQAQVLELGQTPIPPPPGLTAVPPPVESPATPGVLVTLYHAINGNFDSTEIEELAFEVGIASDEYGGETRSARAQALVEHAARHGKLAALVGVARRKRPTVVWPRVALGNGYQSLFDKE